ncbi:hypothetical protein [Fusobacterium mortiferum]|uniref:hypothetical protein n=1 Tax=Fusobacterium mortiferum TaxID=850 RepID=UPI002A7A4107|nr:hypothetical protein [Fusobacterium mortiferum]
MTVDNFFKEISFMNSFLLDVHDHEIDFLFNLADKYKVNKLELAHHILDYREKYVKRPKVCRKVIDLETGFEYRDIKTYTEAFGLDYQKGYRLVMNNPNKFKLVEIDNGRI